MANISTLLASILSARYGRDMRQHLHDAIKAVNDDTEDALGSSLAFNTSTRKLSLKAKNNTPLSEVVIPGGGSGGGSVDSVNGIFPDENGDVTVGLGDVDAVELSEPTNGQVLKFDGTNWVNANESGGGGTSDYTDLTNKPQVNGVTLSGNKTSADLGISGGSNENLLDNPFFTVNTRGFSSVTETSTTEKNLIDRWKYKDSTVTPRTWTWTKEQIKCSVNNETTYSDRWRETYLLQYFDDLSYLVGKTVTMSAKIYGEIYSGTVTIADANTTYRVKTVNLTNTRTIELRIFMGINAVGFSFNVDMNNYSSGYLDFVFQAVKLELGSASTLALDIAPNENLEKVRCNGVMRSNRNLLDNPWFTVNQRGASGTWTSGYIDRWLIENGTVTINSDKTLTFGASTYICQYSDLGLVSKQVTLSALLSDGTIKKKTITVNSETYNSGSDGTFTFAVDTRTSSQRGDSSERIVFYNTNSDSVTVKAVKLELGTESTLALDVAPDYATELLKCQRFYVPLKGYFSGIQLTNATLPIQLSVPMRTTPTISVGGDVIGMVNGTATQGTIQSASVVGLYGNQAVVSLSMIDAYNSALTFDSKTVFNAGLTSGYLSAEF